MHFQNDISNATSTVEIVTESRIMKLVLIGALALAACKGDEKQPPPASVAVGSSKPGARPSTPAKPAASVEIPDAEAASLCEKLIAPDLRTGLEVQAKGHHVDGIQPARLTCFLMQAGGRAAVVFVECGAGLTVDRFKSSAPAFKEKDGSSPWKTVAGPGREARRVDRGFGGLVDGPQIQFWDPDASCSVAVLVEKARDDAAWAASIEKALTAPPL